ncbi:MAG TPA: TIR domain-containing protein [Solirubrobacteraceae bacterium]|nr:TIR domain-containing protein [Solirubrobacteraceae bacterium]
MSETRNVFISHVHEDDRHLGRLKELLADRGLDIRDSSVNASTPNDAKDPDYIKHQILAPKIRWAGTMIVLISPDTKDSVYVDWEIQYAVNTDTRVVGVFAPGASDSDLPDGLTDYADGIVGWNGDRILDAIQGGDVWQDSSGAPRARKDIARHNC